MSLVFNIKIRAKIDKKGLEDAIELQEHPGS